MKVLQGIDIRSPGAAEEVVEAARWAAQLGAKLDLAFVDDYAYSAERIRDAGIRERLIQQWSAVQEAHRSELRGLLQTLSDDLRGEARYLHGRAAPALLEIEDDYELLIVSTRGRKGLVHAFLGSVAERIVRESAIPVLVLRRGESDDGHAGS